MNQVRCSKCGRLYEDDRVDCESCGAVYENKPVKQVPQVSGFSEWPATAWLMSTAAVWAGFGMSGAFMPYGGYSMYGSGSMSPNPPDPKPAPEFLVDIASGSPPRTPVDLKVRYEVQPIPPKPGYTEYPMSSIWRQFCGILLWAGVIAVVIGAVFYGIWG
jgi:hypothetical protein